MSGAVRTEKLLVQLNQIGLALSRERNLDALLDLIVFKTRQFTRAEGGTLYLREGDRLRFVVAQNDRLGHFPGHTRDTVVGLRDVTMPLAIDSLAGYVGVTGEVLNLADAYAIPEDRPYRFNRDFDQRNNYRTKSLLLVPMKEADGNVLGVVQLINALAESGDVVSFDGALEPLALSLASQAAVAVRNACLTKELEEAHYDTILRLACAAEYRDNDTGMHVQRMSKYAAVLARSAGLPQPEVELILHASPMHDIGKIGTPDAILLKPGKLTPEEFRIMQQHTVIGAKILSKATSPVLVLSEQIALTHHEKWDGSGYPNGLREANIPRSGRIVALADVFDAFTTRRVYKPPFSVEEAVAMIREGSGKHFDPVLANLFVTVLPEILHVRQQYAEQETASSAFPSRSP